jgi:hypothetical protein
MRVEARTQARLDDIRAELDGWLRSQGVNV